MLVLEEILELLDDSKRHSLDELMKEFDLSEDQLVEILIILDKLDFVDFDRKNEFVEIKEPGSKVLDLPTESEENERYD